MRRIGARLSVLISVAGLFAVCQPSFAQDFAQKPKPPATKELLGSQLIVWSETQKPYPLSARSTELDAASTKTPLQAQTLTGTLCARNSALFLATAGGSAYRVENDGEQISTLIGKSVRIAATLDATTHELHVLKIEELN